MTTIDRLGLIGIRSYGTDEETFIKFYKPLTIILGRNGSGKSTIIEAVKMATTGDLPPMVEKGAAFIHDPRIHNETETKAKIRLLFTNVRGDQYVVSRHFQLTMKKGVRGIGYKPEFKRLDQTVKRMDGGAASSYRCADLNALLPDIMRVTKPVLNNVIFVHQEDSLWPLGDSKKLKEKFDEIFAATRYTKALDTIRKYRKDQAAELKTINVELMHYEDKVKVLEKVRAEVDKIREKHDELRQGVNTLDREIAKLTADKNIAQGIATEYDDQCAQLEKLRIEGEIIEKDKREKYSEMSLHLPHMTEDAIAAEIEGLETFLDRATGERSKRDKLIQELREDIEGKRTEYLARQNRKGMLEEQAKMQKDRLSDLDAMKEDFCTSEDLSTRGKTVGEAAVELPSKDADIETWTGALTSLFRNADGYVRRVSEEGEKAIDASRTRLSEIQVRLEGAKLAKDRKTIEISQKRAKISTIRSELRSMDDLDAAIRESESRLKTVSALWKEKTESSQVGKLEETITNNRKRILTLREDLSVLRRVREQLVQNQSEQAKYDQCRATASERMRSAEATAEEFGDLLTAAFSALGEDSGKTHQQLEGILAFPEPLMESNAEERRRLLLDASSRVLARRDDLSQKAERRQNEASAALKACNQRLAEQTAAVDEASAELSRAEKQVKKVGSSVCGAPRLVVDSEEATNRLQSEMDKVTTWLQNLGTSAVDGVGVVRDEDIDKIRKTAETVDVAVLKASQRISHLESGFYLAEADLVAFDEDPRHKCPACGLSSTKRAEDMRKNLSNRVAFYKDPESSRQAEEELKNLKRASGALKEVHVVGCQMSALFSQYESEKEKLRKVQRAVWSCQQELADAKAGAEKVQSRCGPGTAAEQVLAKRFELTQAFTDWGNARNEVEAVRASLSVSTNESRSLSEVDRDMRMLEENLQTLQDDIDRDARTLEREREDLHRTESRLHKAKQHQLELQDRSGRHRRLNVEKDELANAIQNLTAEVETVRSEARSLESDLEYVEAEFATVKEERNLASREANTVASRRRAALHSWQECLREVEAYARSGKESELNILTSSLASMHTAIESLSSDLHAHEKDQQTASDSQRDMESKIRNLKDNQRYRIQERRLQVNARSARHVRDELVALERRAEGNPSQKVEHLNNMIHRKNSERSATAGVRQGYTDRYKDKRKELDEAERQGCRLKFDECRIRKQTMELASSDLEKYHRALDQALMAFHTLKMNSINRTVKELWQQTYRGTDIDEIEIISDHGDPRTATAGGLRRTFNYKVQMRQGQATLDMRGRCSAGQKVLACLVIRLALAESFCTDCGILALDEPTTNLDRENIGSLAVALKAIIETRKSQRNFQLVLITHDEEFIDMIGARDYCNEHFMVYKDMRGISRARVQDLQEI